MTKAVRFTRRAAAALRRQRNRSEIIMAKVDAYARDPRSQANNVKALAGSRFMMLRIGDFRLLFEENEDEIIVLEIGPRGGIYD